MPWPVAATTNSVLPGTSRGALAEVNADFVAFCAKQFVEVGIPSSRLYTHVAAPVRQESTTAPIGIAFNPYSRPGWTTYPVGPLAADFDAIYSELKTHGNLAWGGVEANVGIPGSSVSWEAYLARHFNHGATLVGINCGATGSRLPDLLTKSAFGDEAVAAYRTFLSGTARIGVKARQRQSPFSPSGKDSAVSRRGPEVAAGRPRSLTRGKDHGGV